MIRAFIISGSYIAALIGAGFASGGEITSFFVKYGREGVFGIGAASLVFAVFLIIVMEGCRRYKTYSYDLYLKTVMSNRLRMITKLVTGIFAMIVFCTMISGGAEIGEILFGIKPAFGALIVCLIALIILNLKKDIVLSINGILGIIITVMTIVCLIYMLYFREQHTMTAQRAVNAGVSGLTYSGYNILTAGVVLCSMSKGISRCEIAAAGIISGGVLSVIMLLMWGMIGIYYNKIPLGEMPMLTLAIRQGNGMVTVYSIIIFLALITTAISNGMAAVDMIERRMGHFAASALITAVGYFAGGVGFMNLINTAYRACGYVGILLPVYLLINFVKNIKNDKKQRILKKNRIFKE